LKKYYQKGTKPHVFISIFTTVFHRILDFKNGLDVYPGPFFILGLSCLPRQCTQGPPLPWQTILAENVDVLLPQMPPLVLLPDGPFFEAAF
jgi:hypothetical protein